MTTSVLVPASLTREAEDRREATRKLGYVARAAAVFRVDRLCVYPDPGGTGQWEDDFVATVLRYAATPPYLRKEVWDRRPELEYAGVLPPLRVTPRTGSGSNDSGSSRQGIVTEVGTDGRVRVNCGLQHPISLPVPDGVSVEEGERVTVRVSSRRPVRARLVDESPPGFDVETTDLSTALARPDAGLTVAASRHGETLDVGLLGQLVERREAAGGLTVAVGAPERGLPAILDREPPAADADAAESGATDAPDDAATADDAGATDAAATDAADGDPDRATRGADRDGETFDLWLNTVPNQGSEVVRTEEALFATLAPLRLRK